ncbi:Beta-barrel assembly machine subunit BamE [Dyella jiangningensis]|uniref:OmpA family protein n=1 Tax=Dyella sp. AtDHG13 TaxID=1938897 RepID=UPI00087EFDD5|nr:OmpA family protein [Dyella sp. AtDHG13]PXV60325.1 Beta-barrel assembly machine subunit BamE [Dyella sp. AtDHG13]SDJ40838.1 Beta-barrel assembly machine subunit BamE [Dyella jiangningensis]
MNNLWKQIAVAASAALVLAACGNVSRNVAKDGGSAAELVWPAPDSVTPMHKGGTFPSLANLRQVRAGLGKPQISDLIGYPHFSEGLWGVREWNYVFNFRKPGSDEVTVCQYKVLFDENSVARSFYWKPASCAAWLDEPKPAPPAAPAQRRFTLSGDALFAFGKADITPDGRQALAALAARLNEHAEQVGSIRISGYTDRLGTTAGNRSLSERRAQAVADMLVADGVPRSKIRTEGRGESDPVKDCPNGPHAQLVACLAPNRRVEVRVEP